MRVLIAGQRSFGADVLALCLRLGHEVVAVAAPAEGSGPGGYDRLRAAAELQRVPWIPPGALRAGAIPEGTDLILAAHSHEYLGRQTRLRARLGALGYHPSLLPLHRGRDAVRWTVHMGERVAGGTVFWLSENVDAGPVAAQDWCFVRREDDARTLWRRELRPMGVRLFERVLRHVAAGRVVAVPQDEALATWEPAWERAPLPRPELLMIGRGTPVITDAGALRGSD
ncbi:MAG TPA: formyltransferase family protein [Longimicrobium sp.]|nr:formyltransferase family protein [Longimicrobium sp.]